MAFQRSGSRQRLVINPTLCTLLLVTFSIFSCDFDSDKNNAPVSQKHGIRPDVAQTKKIYDTKCAVCHGFDGHQQYAGAKDISATVMNKESIILQIAEGKGSMPPQKDVLTVEEIDALSEFVLAL